MALYAIALACGAVYWWLEAYVAYLLDPGRDLWSHVISPSPEHLWVRASVLILFVAFAAIARYIQRQRRAAQQETSEAQRKLINLMSNLPGMAYRCKNDPEWTMEFVSDGCHSLTGYPAVDLVGNSIVSYGALISDEDQAKVWESVQEAVAARRGFTMEYRIRRNDGEERWVWEQGNGVFDAGGRLVCLEGFITDVTDRRRAEQAFRETKLEVQAILDNVPAVVYVKEPDGRYLLVNRAYEALVNKPRSELLGRTDYDIFSKEVADIFRSNDMIVLRDRKPLNFEERAPHRNGPQIYLSTKFPLLSPSGELYATGGISTDITSRIRQEDRLREREARYRLLIETANMIPWERTLPWDRFSYVGPQGERLLGFAGEDWLSENFWANQLHPEDREQTLRERAAAIAEGRNHELEYRLIAMDGRVRWFNDIASVEFDAGHPHMVRGVLIDITDRKALEEQLRQSQKMEAIGQLAGGVAHDFNNLLTVINSYTAFLLEDIGVDDPIREDVEEIQRAGMRASELTSQLLAFSRKQVRNPVPLNLNAVVPESARMLRRLLGEHIELATDLDPALSDVMADPNQIEQILINLAVNARDAMPRGGRLIIETRNAALPNGDTLSMPEIAPGHYVMLGVHDTGHGIPLEIRDHLFEPFFTTKELGKGTGLGLSTVYGIVKQSGGHIVVQSELERGARFQIYLPCAEAGPGNGGRARSDEPPPRGTETVLLVEDEPDILQLARRILEASGYKVLGASHPEEALKISAKHEGAISLLVTDVVLPKMNGIDLADRLCENRPALKPVFISGYPDSAESRPELKPGINFLQKPFSPADLLRTARAVLDAPAEARV